MAIEKVRIMRFSSNLVDATEFDSIQRKQIKINKKVFNPKHIELALQAKICKY